MTNWTRENIPDLSEKVFIVTGANSGLGYESSVALAENSATVIMACRNLERGQRALDILQKEIPSAKLDLMELDLASLSSIHKFSETFKSKYDRLDVLINNGGPVIAARSLTEDGFESHFGVGHLGHFALTALLLDVLLKTPSGRIVTVTSRMHATAKIEWDDLMSEQAYNPMQAYPQSMLAKILFAFELSRRLEAKGSSTKSIAAHPGLAKTSWADNNLNGLMKIIGKLMSATSYQSASMGALPILYAGTDPNAKGGAYYGPDNDKKGFPIETRAGDVAYNESDAKNLWEISEKLTGIKFEGLEN